MEAQEAVQEEMDMVAKVDPVDEEAVRFPGQKLDIIPIVILMATNKHEQNLFLITIQVDLMVQMAMMVNAVMLMYMQDRMELMEDMSILLSIWKDHFLIQISMT